MEAPTPPEVLSIAGGPPAWAGRAVSLVEAGEVIALPTETFYGLAVDPARAGAVARLLALKRHRAGRGLLLLAASVEQADEVGRLGEIAAARDLAAAFWPGPLTLVVPVRRELPACPGGTVALRVPASHVPRRLAAALGRPVTGTSANRAGGDPAETASRVAALFPRGLSLILDGGPAPGGLPSTLLDLSGPRPRLLRAGAVDPRELEARLGISLAGRGGHP